MYVCITLMEGIIHIDILTQQCLLWSKKLGGGMPYFLIK